jgi:hypothetical protein
MTDRQAHRLGAAAGRTVRGLPGSTRKQRTRRGRRDPIRLDGAIALGCRVGCRIRCRIRFGIGRDMGGGVKVRRQAGEQHGHQDRQHRYLLV